MTSAAERVLAFVIVLASNALAGACLAHATPPHRPYGSGPYPAIMTVEPDLPDLTLYRPAHMAAVQSRKLPIVIWTEGGCVNIGNRSAGMLSEWASHGYLVIAAGPISPTVDGFSPGSRDGERLHGVAQLSQPHQQRAAIEWALRQNQRPDSPLHGRIDTSKIAAAGSSCGGVQAIDLAIADRRISTVIALYSGLFPDGKAPKSVAYAGTYVVRADLPRMRRPMLYLFGGTDDIAFPNALSNLESMPDTPVFGASLRGSLHGEELDKANGGRFGRLALSWLDYILKGDRNARRQFVGGDCSVCSDAEWTITRRNLP